MGLNVSSNFESLGKNCLLAWVDCCVKTGMSYGSGY